MFENIKFFTKKQKVPIGIDLPSFQSEKLKKTSVTETKETGKMKDNLYKMYTIMNNKEGKNRKTEQVFDVNLKVKFCG